MLIGYGSAEVENKMKLADENSIISPSQSVTKNARTGFHCLSLTFVPKIFMTKFSLFSNPNFSPFYYIADIRQTKRTN